jgi:hypothetical protein
MERWKLAVLVGGGVGLGTYLLSSLSGGGGKGGSSSGQGRVSIAGGTLRGPGGVSYSITPTDRLWLKRMVVGESGDFPSRQSAGAALWAMANYHMLVEGPGGTRPKFSTLTGLLRAYSQPINPLWASVGTTKCQQHPGSCTPAHIARRARVTGQTTFSSAIEGAVSDFLAGRLPNPVPGLVDWRAGNWSGCQVNIEGNCFGVSPGRRLA